MKNFNPYKFIFNKIKIRPFDKNMELDSTYTYIHGIDAIILIPKLENKFKQKQKPQ